MPGLDDTIFALATPPGRSAIAVIRISGASALRAAAAFGAAAPAPHSMFLEETPADLNGLSLDETFSRSLRRGALDAAAFLEGSTRLDPSTFVAGKDFVRHNVGSRSMSHT